MVPRNRVGTTAYIWKCRCSDSVLGSFVTRGIWQKTCQNSKFSLFGLTKIAKLFAKLSYGYSRGPSLARFRKFGLAISIGTFWPGLESQKIPWKLAFLASFHSSVDEKRQLRGTLFLIMSTICYSPVHVLYNCKPISLIVVEKHNGHRAVRVLRNRSNDGYQAGRGALYPHFESSKQVNRL